MSKFFSRALVRAALVVAAASALAGCQNLNQPESVAAPEAQSAAPQGAALRVFLADTKPQDGWTAVMLKPRGILYIHPDEIVTRADLMGIQSATDQEGEGILVLVLKPEGVQKLQRATAASPGKRLALVVGNTMLAAPAYTAPIAQQQLAFAVGSAENAAKAALSVAGGAGIN